MLITKTPLDPWTPAIAGEWTTLNVNLGRTYRSIGIEYKESGVLATAATIATALEEVELVINGSVVRRETAAYIQMKQALIGKASNDGYLDIDFAEEWANAIASQEYFALGSGDLNSIQLRIKIASGRTAPSIKATARVNIEAQTQPSGIIKKTSFVQVTVSATGTVNVALPRTENITALHAESSDIDSVKVTGENTVIFEQTKEQHENDLVGLGLTPQAGWFSVPFNASTRHDDFLPVFKPVDKKHAVSVHSLQADFEMNAANNFRLYIETLAPVN